MYQIESFSFQYFHSTPILRNLNLTINQGDFILLVGKSGSGKTTFLKHLCPSLIPKGQRIGNIYYSHQPIQEVQEVIGFVMQNPDDQIVMDNVSNELAFGLENLGMDIDQMRQRVSEIVCYFHLNDIYTRSCDCLSGGQKQILNLAAIVAMNPEVIILDEPLSQLDPEAATRFVNLLKLIHDDFGTTIIISSHSNEQLLPICNRMIVLNQGEIMLDDHPDIVVNKLVENYKDLLPILPEYVQLTKKITLNEARKDIKNKKVIYHLLEHSFLKETILTIQHLDCVLDHQHIIKSCNLNIKSGGITTIIGANGSGKTTLLKCIMGIYPYKGRILYQHKKINTSITKILMLPQNPQSLFVKDSVKEELSRYNQQEVEQLLKMYQLDNLKDCHPYDLSVGQQQLLGLSILVLQKPSILLLDEPTKGLDGIAKQQLGKYLQKLTSQGLTVIMVSHDLEFCAQYANECGMLFNGKVQQIKNTREFFLKQIFYTTVIARLFKSIGKNVITLKDVSYHVE